MQNGKCKFYKGGLMYGRGICKKPETCVGNVNVKQ